MSQSNLAAGGKAKWEGDLRNIWGFSFMCDITHLKSRSNDQKLLQVLGTIQKMKEFLTSVI